MQTVKHVALAAGTAHPAESVTVDRSITVREQSALFSARLALARWTSGGDIPHLQAAAIGMPPLRAAWYASASRHFQEWLECGGFAQHDEPELAAQAEPPVTDGTVHRAGACID
jgi:hypothetical protein